MGCGGGGGGETTPELYTLCELLVCRMRENRAAIQLQELRVQQQQSLVSTDSHPFLNATSCGRNYDQGILAMGGSRLAYWQPMLEHWLLRSPWFQQGGGANAWTSSMLWCAYLSLLQLHRTSTMEPGNAVDNDSTRRVFYRALPHHSLNKTLWTVALLGSGGGETHRQQLLRELRSALEDKDVYFRCPLGI